MTRELGLSDYTSQVKGYAETFHLFKLYISRKNLVGIRIMTYYLGATVIGETKCYNKVCVDFRQLNNVIVFDLQPIYNPDDLIDQVGQRILVLDLTKGYWKIRH